MKPQPWLNTFKGPHTSLQLVSPGPDQIIVPSPYDGLGRLIQRPESMSGDYMGGGNGISGTYTTDMFFQDGQGNELQIGTIGLPAGAPAWIAVAITEIGMQGNFFLVEGEQIISRDLGQVAAGRAMMWPVWTDAEVINVRKDLDASLQVVAQPKPGTALVLPDLGGGMATSYIRVFNWDSAIGGIQVDLFMSDGQNDIQIDSVTVAPDGAVDFFSLIASEDLFIPDGGALKAQINTSVTPPNDDGRIFLAASFVALQAAKRA